MRHSFLATASEDVVGHPVKVHAEVDGDEVRLSGSAELPLHPGATYRITIEEVPASDG